MKSTSLLSLLVVVSTISAQAQSKKVVEFPPAMYNNSTVEIAKVTLSDTETTLDINAYFTPGYWIKIVSDSYLQADGKKYLIKNGDGIELDSLFWMPKSGEATFKLIFEPLPKNTKTFDFIESDCDNCFKVYEIDLVNKSAEKPIQTVLKGKVHNRPQSKTLLLAKADADLRVNPYIPIRIDSLGNFQHKFYADNMEAYMLIFDEEYGKSWRTEIFFPDADTVHISLNPENELIKNSFLGGKLNEEYQNYYLKGLSVYDELNKERKQLIDTDNYFTKEFTDLMKMFENETDEKKKDSLIRVQNKIYENGTYLTDEGKKSEDKYKIVQEERNKSSFKWIATNGTLAGYYVLISYLNRFDDKSNLIDIYHNLYAKKFPEHPYTLQAKNLIESLNIKVGNKFIDFTAPDSNGESHTLSTLIQGKVAMINLWASWCGPCRRHGKELIPVFEKYKNHDFTVVGVAREENRSNMINAVAKDGYPWLNLLELNDKNNIWEKYGASNAGGRLILVNREGIILAIDPPIEETIRLVEKELKN